MKLALALCLWPGLAWAEGPMTGAEFEAFSEGKTVTYEAEGQVFGREEYRAGRQVVWQAGEGGTCAYGRWFDAGKGEICFAYDGGSGPVCWRFDQSGGQVTARSVASPDAAPLVARDRSEAGLACPGPDVGV